MNINNNHIEKHSNIKQIRLSKYDKILIIEQFKFNSINEILDKTAQYLQLNKTIIELYPTCNNDNELFNLSLKLMQLVSIFDSIFLIKDRLDISKLIDADGIILDSKSINYSNAIKLLSKDKIFGYEISNTQTLEYINNFDFIQQTTKEEQQLNTKQTYTLNQIERLN